MKLYVYTFSHPSVTSHIIGLNSLLAGRLIGMEEKRNAYEILLRDPKRKTSLVDSDINGRIVLKLILKVKNVMI